MNDEKLFGFSVWDLPYVGRRWDMGDREEKRKGNLVVFLASCCPLLTYGGGGFVRGVAILPFEI